jgi:hypothetical protein
VPNIVGIRTRRPTMADPGQPDFDLQDRIGVRSGRREVFRRQGLLWPPFYPAR